MSTRRQTHPFADSGGHAVRLSPAGEARRAEMLIGLAGAVRARGRRRIAVKFGTIAGAIAVLVVSALVVSKPSAQAPSAPRSIAGSGSPTESPSPRETPNAAPAHDLGSAPTVQRLVGYVANDTSIVSRLAPSDSPGGVRVIDDDELLRTLDSAGISAGIVRTPERMRLAFHQSESAAVQ